jgi:hypothetical protein
VAKKKAKLWFGYLEAGDRSSPVVRDDSIDTGRSSTVYLFNSTKGRILEYRRDIVEPKLRELDESETEMISELEDGYRDARTGFSPRGSSRPRPSPIRRAKPVEPELPDVDEPEDSWQPSDDEAGDSCPVEASVEGPGDPDLDDEESV